MKIHGVTTEIRTMAVSLRTVAEMDQIIGPHWRTDLRKLLDTTRDALQEQQPDGQLNEALLHTVIELIGHGVRIFHGGTDFSKAGAPGCFLKFELRNEIIGMLAVESPEMVAERAAEDEQKH